MKTHHISFAGLVSAAVLLNGLLCQTGRAQSFLNESGTSILAPSQTPIGGYGANPQEYLTVAWSVVESAPGNYLYSYTVHNPSGDVLMTPTGALTSTAEIFDGFSVDFNTTLTSGYLPGTQTGGAVQEVNPIDVAWFFSPFVSAGSSAPTVSFQSDFPPTSGNASADGPVPLTFPLNEWSTTVPVPNDSGPPTVVPEPAPMVLFALAGFLFLPIGIAMKKKTTLPSPAHSN